MTRTTDRVKPTTAHRFLRREVPGTVAVLASEADFAAMRRHKTFPFRHHDDYLHHLEALLRALARQGLYLTLALFDPVAYDHFCAERALRPDRPASRTRYTAELACRGVTLPYDGRPLAQLVPELIKAADHRATWENATAILAGADRGSLYGEGPSHAALARARRATHRLHQALGPGTHHLVCSVPAPRTPLFAVLHTSGTDTGGLDLWEAEALEFCTVLAAGIVLGAPGGIVSRTRDSGSRDILRGWTLRDSWPRPLTAAEVFTAYCTDADTGEPVPPQPGVDYHPGIPIPPPEPDL